MLTFAVIQRAWSDTDNFLSGSLYASYLVVVPIPINKFNLTFVLPFWEQGVEATFSWGWKHPKMYLSLIQFRFNNLHPRVVVEKPTCNQVGFSLRSFVPRVNCYSYVCVVSVLKSCTYISLICLLILPLNKSDSVFQ